MQPTTATTADEAKLTAATDSAVTIEMVKQLRSKLAASEACIVRLEAELAHQNVRLAAFQQVQNPSMPVYGCCKR